MPPSISPAVTAFPDEYHRFFDRVDVEGAWIGPYKILRRLYDGNAVVFEGLAGSGQRAAVKCAKDQHREYFSREIAALQSLQQSHWVVRYLGADVSRHGFPWLATEFVSGRDLESVVGEFTLSL